ncbi:MAG: hypothetical protein GY791_08365 [Alphaproteobacteria bacterium]|nr:hypothetical protein [Alphaproteobacteria bacterium]
MLRVNRLVGFGAGGGAAAAPIIAASELDSDPGATGTHDYTVAFQPGIAFFAVGNLDFTPSSSPPNSVTIDPAGSALAATRRVFAGGISGMPPSVSLWTYDNRGGGVAGTETVRIDPGETINASVMATAFLTGTTEIPNETGGGTTSDGTGLSEAINDATANGINANDLYLWALYVQSSSQTITAFAGVTDHEDTSEGRFAFGHVLYGEVVGDSLDFTISANQNMALVTAGFRGV